MRNLLASMVCAAAFAAPPSASAQEIITDAPPPYQLDAEISVYLGGLEILKFDWQTVQQAGIYQSASHVYPVGVVAMLFDIDVASTASGRVSAGAVQPAQFESQYAEDGDIVRSVRIGFDDSGPVEVTRVGGDQTIAEDDILKVVEGMIDPLSAAMFNETFLTNGEVCASGRRIFSGESAYTLDFDFVKETTLKKSRYSDYEGPAYLCKVDGQPLAAFNDEARERMEARTSDEKPSTLYIGRIAAPSGDGELLVPVKVLVPTSFGTAVAHLTHYRVSTPEIPKLAEK